VRILIFRPDNIGDVVLFSGAFKHIRVLYPDAHITLAVQKHIVNLVESCPQIDKVISLGQLKRSYLVERISRPSRNIFKRIIKKLIRAYNASFRRFDIIIYPVKSPQVNHLRVLNALKGRKIYGITGCTLNEPRNGYPSNLHPVQLYTNNYNVTKFDPWVHELIVTADFLTHLGCQVSSIDEILPEFWLHDGEVDHLSSVKEQGRPIVGLFPGATSELRRWPSVNYGNLAQMMGESYLYVIFGSEAEQGLAAQIQRHIEQAGADFNVLNLAGQTTLRELVKNISLCDLLVSMDSSGLHIAIAAGIPTVGIVGGGHYGRFVPWGNNDRNVFLIKSLDCYHCNWFCTRDFPECVHGVCPHEVAETAERLLMNQRVNAKLRASLKVLGHTVPSVETRDGVSLGPA